MAKVSGKTIKVRNATTNTEFDLSLQAWNLLHEDKDGTRSGFAPVVEKPKEPAQDKSK